MLAKANDRINSGAGSDTYLYRKGDGSDVIDDENRSTTDVDVLKLLDLNPADVELTKNGVHAYLKVVSTGDVITLDDQFWSATENWGIEEIRFARRYPGDRAKINDLTSVTRGTSGNDTAVRHKRQRHFDAGKGDDASIAVRVLTRTSIERATARM